MFQESCLIAQPHFDFGEMSFSLTIHIVGCAKSYHHSKPTLSLEGPFEPDFAVANNCLIELDRAGSRCLLDFDRNSIKAFHCSHIDCFIIHNFNLTVRISDLGYLNHYFNN